MKYRNNNSYYIPDLSSRGINPICEYRLIDEENANLKIILQYVSDSIRELLKQYPDAFEPEEIFSLVDRNYKKISNLGFHPEDCYSYFGRCNGSIHGIRIYPVDSLEDPYLFSMNMVTNIGKNYQRKVDLVYDVEEDSFLTSRVVEKEQRNDIIVQSQFSPKVLRKKRYIQY